MSVADEPSGCPAHAPAPPSGCPAHGGSGSTEATAAAAHPGLAASREVSSIPKADGSRWEYPSEQQFYKAMERKNLAPQAGDMPFVIPIHNAVNEKCWQEILDWERGTHSACAPKLVRFAGTKRLTPRALWNMAWGASRPFDRHDWVVERCGQTIEYVIDFYTGAPDAANPHKQSFYLDVRPKLNSIEGARMRFNRFWYGA